MAGKFFEDLAVGQRIDHPLGRTVTETDNVLFCGLTMNTQPLHLDAQFAAATQFGRCIVNGVFTLGLTVGLTVGDLTAGTIVANLSYDRVLHPAPVFPGDTLRVTTEVLEKRPSSRHPDRGVIRLRHLARNQHGAIVVDVERSVLFLKRPGP
jgi:acyl dehydratase